MSMTKWFACLAFTATLTFTLGLGGTALADDTTDKQIAACEKIRGGVAKNAKCPDQAKTAAAMTCTAQTAPQAKTLFDECLKVITAKPAAGSKTVTCKGLDESGAELATATGPTTIKCGKALAAELTAKLCDGTASKAVKYQFVRESGKPVKSSLYCKKAKK
jgi:hypothetical protein